MHKVYLTLTALAASVASVVALVIFVDPSPAPQDLFEGLHLSAPEFEEVIEDEVLNSPTVSYQSDTFRYKLSYPGNWDLDDSRKDLDGDIISDPTQRAIMVINQTKDPSVMSAEGTAKVIESIRDSLRHDSNFSLKRFESFEWEDRPAVFTDGVRIIDGKRYRTREYNIIRQEHGGMLNISVTTQENTEALYDEVIQNILQSLDVCPK